MGDMASLDDLCHIAREKIERGADSCEILYWLKQLDVSIIDAIKIVRKVFAIPLGEAKEVVSSHSAWSSTAEGAETLHEIFIEAIDSFRNN